MPAGCCGWMAATLQSNWSHFPWKLVYLGSVSLRMSLYTYKCLICQLFFLLHAALMFHADETRTQTKNKKFHCAAFLAALQTRVLHHFPPVEENREHFVKTKHLAVTTSRDLAVPSQQLAAGHKDIFCDPSSSGQRSNNPKTTLLPQRTQWQMC